MCKAAEAHYVTCMLSKAQVDAITPVSAVVGNVMLSYKVIWVNPANDPRLHTSGRETPFTEKLRRHCVPALCHVFPGGGACRTCLALGERVLAFPRMKRRVKDLGSSQRGAGQGPRVTRMQRPQQQA